LERIRFGAEFLGAGDYATKNFSLRFKSFEFCPAEAGNWWRLSIEWVG